MKSIIEFLKRNRLYRYSLITMVLAVSATVVYAASVPQTFTAGTVAKSSEVNENFDYLDQRSWELSGTDLYYENGNIGIGTTSPDFELDVAGDINFTGVLRQNGTPISWEEIPGAPGVLSLTLYVNASTGKDEAGSGLSPDKPFQTIGYALDNMTPLGATFETETVISIAPGQYNENLVIDKDHIWIEGGGSTSVIIDGGGQDIITIGGARGVVIKGVTLQNGNEGIIGKRGAAFEVRNTTVQDSADEGIQVDENSTAQLTDCTVQRSGEDGIGVYRSSSASFSGTTVSKENGKNGISILGSSSAFFDGATVTTEHNGIRGIATSQTSSLISSNSTVTVQNNTNGGVGVFGSSSLALVNDATLLVNNNDSTGLIVRGSSLFSVDNSSKIAVRDSGNFGVYVNLSSSLWLGGNMEVLNNTGYGIFVIRTSSLEIYDNGSATVESTKYRDGTAQGIGIGIWEGSAMRMLGTLLIEDNDSDGLQIGRSSHAALRGTGSNAEIKLNRGKGVDILYHSSGRFDGVAVITDNTLDGIMVRGNSELTAYAIDAQNNHERGVAADDGSSISISNSTITGNWVNDVVLTFGSRASLYGGTIGTITCDGTVLSRGDHVCP